MERLKTYATLTIKQLQQLIENCDEDKEIRVWVEEKNEDDVSYLSGRRLIGVQENPNDSFISFVAAFYKTEEEVED